MSIRWGYSPKVEKYIPLGNFPADRYLIIAQQAIENLGWKLSHLSASGIIAYTKISLESYSEEISIRITSNFAVFKSECIGVQLLFTDYGKNDKNLQKFFDEFEYVEFHLKDIWQERIESFQEHIASHDDSYFELAPLRAKDRIKNAFYLFYPQKGYLITPILVNLNILYGFVLIGYLAGAVQAKGGDADAGEILTKVYLALGANSRMLALSGEIWRLITYQFIHLSFSHLFFNMYALIYIGLMVENKLGSLKTLGLYLLSGICGGLLSICFHEVGLMAGASGSIMGMFGAFLALLISNAFEKNANKALLISTVILTAYMLINGAMSKRVDNAAHLGGLLSGFLIGYLLFNTTIANKAFSDLKRSFTAGIIVLIFGLAVFTFSNRYQIEEYAKLKYEFNKNDLEFGNIYYIQRNLPLDEKLSRIKKYGLDVWQRNLTVTANMSKMVLTERDQIDCKYRTRIAQKAYHVSLMLYQDYKSGNPQNQVMIAKKMNEVNKMKMELAEILRKMD
ncbi:rhomboid family intramembrane serine protease [Pedobacter metabolipauper]|uniref:Rhomboid protease GluP n=1 Tax=Pedobacter metabolipauper TaxID=425513 RepID=A0A4R6SZ83_9SPHI|nr:rhomboid family intramembrane serine protease [Pedobacter metabolipauper]TDQ09845.1 rhomboid protease GluP [Pedobacter metabolipauper]